MSALTPQPLLSYLKDRLRAGDLVEPELVSDPDLLVMLSEAYQDVCERTRCLVTFTETAYVPGEQTYTLPDRWFETMGVFTGGITLPEIAHRDIGWRDGRSHVGRTITFSLPVPTGGSFLLWYAESPPALTTWGDALDPRFPAEYGRLLVHHVRWRVLALAGGAQRIPFGRWEHTQYDTGVERMRRMARRVDSVGPMRLGVGRAR